MATSFDQIVAQTRAQLLGFAKDQEQYSSLTANMGATDTSFVMDTATASAIGRGTVQIDDELMLVKSVDRTSGTASLLGNLTGRGREGTTATTHSTDALVVMSPAFPNVRIKEAINATIRGVYPHLVVFKSTEITKLAPQIEYSMPADAMDVWYVALQTIGPSKVWYPAQNWRFNPNADTTTGDFPNGKSIQLMDEVVPGRLMRVVYSTTPTTLTNASDDFATVTGLPERCVDLIVYGAVWRLLPAYEAARLQQRAVEATERSPLVPTASASKTTQLYLALYQQRLEEERARMFAEVPNFQYFQG
jgi:hypothetical protein